MRTGAIASVFLAAVMAVSAQAQQVGGQRPILLSARPVSTSSPVAAQTLPPQGRVITAQYQTPIAPSTLADSPPSLPLSAGANANASAEPPVVAIPSQQTLQPMPVLSGAHYAWYAGNPCAGAPVARASYAPAVVYPSTTAFRPLVPLEPMPSSYYVGRGLIGQPKLYVPGQPVRNVLRYLSP